MALRFNIQVNGERNLIRKLNKVPHALNRQFFAEAAEMSILSIQSRTLAGKDADEKQFEPYTPAYKLFLRKHGRSESTVNLFYHGDMFNSMTYDSTSNSAMLFFANTSDRTGSKNPKKAYFLQQKREFFALSQSDIQSITNLAQQYIRRQLHGRK